MSYHTISKNATLVSLMFPNLFWSFLRLHYLPAFAGWPGSEIPALPVHGPKNLKFCSQRRFSNAFRRYQQSKKQIHFGCRQEEHFVRS